ncbi:MAG: hypothetical protein IT261_14485 [Saprospiraceae bacterium]|nr:hypothetical protein [Saprospiraceae bacterium]
MKNILLFAAIILIGLVSSCKKDETPKELTLQERLIGKWKATKVFIGTTDVLIPTATTTTELEVEFKSDKTVALNWTNTILTTTPPTVSKSTLNGVYSWTGDILTLTAINGSDMRTVTGPVVITDTRLEFTPTSGNTNDFISLLEADRL